MKIKTAELEGHQLNYAVAIAEGYQTKGVVYTWNGQAKFRIYKSSVPCEYEEKIFNFAYDWSQGGEIIEREKIGIGYSSDANTWGASKTNIDKWAWGSDENPLVAAMRCYVASVFGDTVDIPESVAAI